MRIKHFTARSMGDALKLVKSEMGEDALILASKDINTPQGKMVEVTAALDEVDLITEQVQVNKTALSASSKIDVSSNLSPLEELLAKHGVMKDLRKQMVSAVNALGETGFSDYDTLDMVLGKLVPFKSPGKVFKKGVAHIFVGPTGSGKTTTLCKLAVSKKVDKQSIGFITLDNIKVGALEQISIYADAMKEKAYLVKSPEELDNIITTIGHRDFLFIDTPGINPFNTEQLDNLTRKIRALDIEAIVHLVLPAPMNPVEMAAIPTACAKLQPQSLLFTKLDETSHLGGLTNVAAGSGLPVCYFTDGPRVPHDIGEMDASLLAEKLLKTPRFPWEKQS